ncbi:MAG: hypothetical protein QM796_11395 [Chthoniobacteraceae bacterium]
MANGQNITSQVVAGTFYTDSVSAGGRCKIVANITVKTSVKSKSKSFLLTTKSVGNAQKVDVNQALVYGP